MSSSWINITVKNYDVLLMSHDLPPQCLCSEGTRLFDLPTSSGVCTPAAASWQHVGALLETANRWPRQLALFSAARQRQTDTDLPRKLIRQRRLRECCHRHSHSLRHSLAIEERGRRTVISFILPYRQSEVIRPLL